MKLLFFVFSVVSCAQVIDVASHPRNWEGTQITSNFTALHTIPALPSWSGGANTIIKDPTYGTRILRATDGTTLSSYGYANASLFMWSSTEGNAWRKDDTMFVLEPEISTVGILMSFNPSTFQVTRLPTASAWSCGSAFNQFGGSPVFSFADNNAIYGNGSGCTYPHSFVRYDLASMSSYSKIYDFSTIEPKMASGSYDDISVSGTVTGKEIFEVAGCGYAQNDWTCVVVYNQGTGQVTELDFTQGIKAYGSGSFTSQSTSAGWNQPLTLGYFSGNYTDGLPISSDANVFACSAGPGGAAGVFVCVTSGGSGYAVNDTGTLNCGTGGTQSTYTVSGVSGGAVTNLTISGIGTATYTYLTNCSTTRSTGSGSGMALFIPPYSIHNVRMGHDGQYVAISLEYNSSGCFQIVWDTLHNTATCMLASAYPNGGHKVQGYFDEAVSSPPAGDYGPQVLLANLTAPSSPTKLLPGSSGPTWFGGPEYVAWQAADPLWLVPIVGITEEASYYTNGGGGAGATTGTGSFSGWLTATQADQLRQTIWVFGDMHAPGANGYGPLVDLYRSSSQSTNQVTIGAAGSSYAVNDTGKFTCGSGDATYKITSVSGGGVTGFQITSPGSKYSYTTGCATSATTGSGSGFTINIGSIWSSFYDYPRGNVSPDGKYVAVSTPWEGVLGTEPNPGYSYEPFRMDVFVYEVKPLTPQTAPPTVATGSTMALFTTLAPDNGTLTASVYTSLTCSGSPLASASDTVRDGRTSQIVVMGLSASTQYCYKITDANGNLTLQGTLGTRSSGSGATFPMLFSSAQAVKYCTNAGMSLGCNTLSAASKQNIPVPGNSAIYAQPSGGSISVFIAP